MKIRSRITIFLVVGSCCVLALQHIAAQQVQEEPITTPDQCVKEMLRVRDLLNGQHAALLLSCEGTPSLSDRSLLEQTASEARHYRDELLSALSAMQPTTPKFSAQQIEELKSQPIRPVTPEMIQAMKLQLGGDASSEDAEAIVVAPPLNGEALQAWERQANRRDELKALLATTQNLSHEARIGILKSWDETNKAAETADRDTIGTGMREIATASSLPTETEAPEGPAHD